MISVNFTSDVENVVATEHLYQWDNGQKLKISGVGTNADIHFANKKSEKALVVTPTITSGAMVAFIPNSLLADPYPILAYIYVPSDNGSKTIKSVTIYVEARKQPSDFVLEDDVGVTTLESISQRANAIMSSIQTDYNNFKNTIQGELDDMVANTTIPNADMLDGYHASDFTLKTEIPTSLPANGGTSNIAIYQSEIELDAGTDVLAYIASDSCPNMVVTVVRVLNCPSCPTEYGYSADSNDFFYQIFKLDNSFATVKAYDTRSNIEFINSLFIGDWLGWTRCNDGGNANSVNGVTFLVGTATPQVTDSSAEGYVPEGAWYGKYKADTT